MNNKLLKKVGSIFLSAIICTSTLPICTTTVCASEGEKIIVNGEEKDCSDEDSLSVVIADNGAEVIVDGIDVAYTKNDPEAYERVYVVNVNSGSEVTVNEDVYVTVDGTMGWDETIAIFAGNESLVDIKGDICIESDLVYTNYGESASSHANCWYVNGIRNYNSEVNVDGDVIVSTEQGDAHGIDQHGGVTNIKGSILVSGENNEYSNLYGAELVLGKNEQPSVLIVDGDIDVSGGYDATGLRISEGSKAYIKGNMNINAGAEANGLFIRDNAIAVIDGTLSVEATNTDWYRRRIAMPYNPYEMDDSEDNSTIYVYKYVDNTKYIDGTVEVEEMDEDGKPYTVKHEVHDIPGGIRPEYDQNFSHLKYIIKTDEGITTNAKVFSDAELGIKGFYYGSEGEAITVRSSGATIYGIKNKDSSIDIKVRDNGDGSWTIIVPKGGGVHLQAILEKAEEVIEAIENIEETLDENYEETKPSVILVEVVMTKTEMAENVVGSVEYVAKQAEIEAAMAQVLNDIETMPEAQVKVLKETGLAIDAGGCTVANAKVAQLILKAIDNGIPMKISFKVNGSLAKITIPAGFNIRAYINADGTIDFAKLLSAIQQMR